MLPYGKWGLEGALLTTDSPYGFTHELGVFTPIFSGQKLESKEASDGPRDSLLVDGRAGHVAGFPAPKPHVLS